MRMLARKKKLPKNKKYTNSSEILCFNFPTLILYVTYFCIPETLFILSSTHVRILKRSERYVCSSLQKKKSKIYF